MPPRQTLPTTWLLTDERLGDAVWTAIGRVPTGGGLLLRHHHGDEARAGYIAAIARERGLMLAVAGDVALARAIGATMVHNPEGETDGLLVSRSVHDAHEARAARGADLVFVSPLFATRSHPVATSLGIERGLALARIAAVPAIALGGVDDARGKAAMEAGFHGWAGIDAWTT